MPGRRMFLAATAAFLSVAAWPQTPTGTIEGLVSDPSGAVIVGASVSITEVSTGRTILLKTNELGRYSLRNLIPGTYRVKTEAAAFATELVDNVALNTGAVVDLNFALTLGQAGETISISAEAILVDTSRQTVDTIVAARDMTSLPLFSRNFLDFAGFAPGVTIRDGKAIDPAKTRAYRSVGIAGRSGTATRVQVDGIDITDESVGTTVANIGQGAVQEFQLTQSSLDISTSLTSSGTVNIISKSGSNEIHGDWFWDYYNQDMGARLGYETASRPFRRNRTGVAMGGPIVKHKLLGFVNWERHYQTEENVVRAPLFPQWNQAQAFPIGIRYVSGRLDWNAGAAVRVFYRFNYDWNISTGGSAISPFWTNINTAGVNFNTPP